MIGIGIASGPIVGGLIKQGFGWEWAFYVNVPLCVVLFFLTTLALISGNHAGWTSATILTEWGTALALLVVFVAAELSRRRPMLQGVTIAQFAFAGGLLTMLTYLPVYFQSALGFGPAKAGMMMIPMFLVPWLGSRYLPHRLSGRAILTIGLLFDAAGLAWLAVSAPEVEYVAMIDGIVLGSIGVGQRRMMRPRRGNLRRNVT